MTKEELLQQIKIHNQAYREGHPVISDQEYDDEVSELKKIDPNNPWFKYIEPVQISESRKVKLPIPMKSLNKVKNLSDLKKWYQSLGLTSKSSLVCMPKFDGISLLHDEITGMTYSRGGAENEGQNCTSHYNTAEIYSPKTDFQFTFGEFIFSRENWRKFKQEVSGAEENFKSPRNTAAGSINRDTPCDYLKYVSFFRYGTDDQSLQKHYLTFEQMIDDMCEQYKQPKLFRSIIAENLSDEYLITLFKQWSKEYAIDGIVVYVNDLRIWEKIGRNQTTGNPLYAIAYKHPDFTDSFETTVKDVMWKVSKSGALKPVVKIEAVDTGDCNMENPTGYNAKWIDDNVIAKGAKILVTRSGGVIPKIIETLQPPTGEEYQKLWDDMKKCPHCGSPTEWNESGVELCCTNKNCPGIQLAKIVFFFKILGAENMGEETISKLFNAGYNTICKILDITFEEIVSIDGFGDVTANQILNVMSSIRSGVEVTCLMHASDCFTGIGQVKAKSILSQMSLEQKFSFYSGTFPTWANNEELFNSNLYKDAGVTQRAFMAGILPFYQFVAENRLIINPVDDNDSLHEGKLSGMKVCFTGIRDQDLEKYIKDNGGEVVNGVSKKTTHLIVADMSSESSKATKARQLGIAIMTIDDFRKMY